jgi:hypothetical protein
VRRPATAGPPGATPKPMSGCFIGRGCTHTGGIPDFPICGQSGPHFPFPAASGTGGFPDSSAIPAESGTEDSLSRLVSYKSQRLRSLSFC